MIATVRMWTLLVNGQCKICILTSCYAQSIRIIRTNSCNIHAALNVSACLLKSRGHTLFSTHALSFSHSNTSSTIN